MTLSITCAYFPAIMKQLTLAIIFSYSFILTDIFRVTHMYACLLGGSDFFTDSGRGNPGWAGARGTATGSESSGATVRLQRDHLF